MRVCSICGARNEDWMEICERCGNSIENANQVEDYQVPEEVKKKTISYSYNQNDDNYVSEKKTKKDEYKEPKEPRIIENADLKLIIIVLLVILIALIAYTIFVIS